MQGFGAQTHLFSEVTGPQQFERTKKKCPMELRKLLNPFLLTPLQRDFLTMLINGQGRRGRQGRWGRGGRRGRAGDARDARDAGDASDAGDAGKVGDAREAGDVSCAPPRCNSALGGSKLNRGFRGL